MVENTEEKNKDEEPEYRLWLTCPNCGKIVEQIKCKLICPYCKTIVEGCCE